MDTIVEEKDQEAFYRELIALLKTNISKQECSNKKIEICKKYGVKKLPTDIQVLIHATKDDLDQLRLTTKPVRTISGVAPLAVMTRPERCPHGKCTFCPGGPGSYFGDTPQSYVGHAPATLRGIRNDFDSYLQVMNRLQQYTLLGQSAEKVELIIMGGTFPATPIEYQEEFVTYAFKGMNDFGQFYPNNELDYIKFKEFFELPGKVGAPERLKNIKEKLLQQRGETILEQEQEKNETAKFRCVGLTIETKPDWGFLEHGNNMLRLGCTRVELGIESVYDEVLKATHRGHDIKDTIKSMRILKDLGFKINAHYMPGLPLTTIDMDKKGLRELFDNPDFRPDMLKIYPTMVSKGTGLYHQWEKGEFTPLTREQAAEIIADFKNNVPEYCRIMRIQRDVPTKYWSAGVDLTNLRQFVHEKYKPTCRCIRCREPSNRKVDYDNVQIKVTEYPASNGTEFFIAAEDKTNDILIGFCRMRFPSECLRDEITPTTALIRELHVYGSSVPIGEEGQVQHRGFGSRLLKKAEEIAIEHGKDKMVVIAGVGVRQYYYKQGYTKDNVYVSKQLE